LIYQFHFPALNLKINLLGRHQYLNAASALAALEVLEGNKLAAITALEENYLIFKNKIDVK